MTLKIAMIMVLGLFTSISSALADDTSVGEELFKQKCNTCHTTVPDKNMVGPSLYGVFGRQSGQAPGFKYSENNIERKIVWNEPTLDAYLANPWDVVPGTQMTFRGLDDPIKRVAIIAFLKANIRVDTPLERAKN